MAQPTCPRLSFSTASVSLTPRARVRCCDDAQTLTFEWGSGVNVQKTPPKTTLTAALADGQSPVVFKVKTTAPKRYVVKPPQGVVLPGQSAKITLTMVVKDAVDLLNKSKSGVSMEDEMKDKFLVQSAPIDDEYHTTNLRGKDDKTVAGLLANLWPDIQKKDISSSRLTTKFTFAERPQIDPNVGTTAPNAAPSGSPEAIFGELSALRKKYDDLVTYTVVLTGERDYLNSELTTVKAKLAEAQSSKTRSDKDASNKESSDVAKPESSGFNIVVVLVVALLAFLGGRFMS